MTAFLVLGGTYWQLISRGRGLPWPGIDLTVYYEAGRAVRQGHGVYDLVTAQNLPFTYPPITLAPFVGLSVVSRDNALYLINFAGLAALGLVVWLTLGMSPSGLSRPWEGWGFSSFLPTRHGTTWGDPLWYLLAVLVLVAGLFAARNAHRRGLDAYGMVLCAVTALLISPISWSHHWVWIAPGLLVLVDNVQRVPAARRPLAAWLPAGVLLVMFAWPLGTGGPRGLLWRVPNGQNRKYHWTLLQWLNGESFTPCRPRFARSRRSMEEPGIPWRS